MPENYEKEVILSYEKLLPAEELLIREINVALRANIFSKSWKTDYDLLYKFSDGETPYWTFYKEKFSKDISFFQGNDVALWEKFIKLKMNLEGRWETTTVIDESDHELYNAENNTVNIEKIKQIMTSGNKEELQTLLQTMNRMYFVNENVFSKEEGEALISVACDVILSITIDSSTVMGYTNLLSQLSDLHRWWFNDEQSAWKFFMASEKMIDQLLQSKQYNVAVLDRLFQRLANNLPSSFTQEDYQRIYKKCYSIYEINPCETNISTLNILHSLSEKLFPTSIMSIMDEAAEIYIKQLGHQHHNAAPLFSSAISNPLYEYVDKLSKTNQEEIFLEELISLTDLSKKSILVSTYLFHCSRNSGSNLYKSIKTMVNNDNRLNACTKLLFCTESNYQGLYKSIFWMEEDDSVSDEEKFAICEMLKAEWNYTVRDWILQDSITEYTYNYNGIGHEVVSLGSTIIKESSDTNAILAAMKSYTNYIQGTDSSLTMKQVGLTLEEVNAKINAVSDNSQKQLLWMYSLCLFGKESIGKLNQFATEEVLWIEESKLLEMYAVSPHWDREKAIFLNDLLQMRMIKEMFPEKEILTTLFDTYNITRFSRYGVNVLSHLFENKDAPTWKPVFPIFMSKSDWNGAIDSMIGNEDRNWLYYQAQRVFEDRNINDLLPYYDVRVFEPWWYPELFFPKMEKFHTSYLWAGGTRENPNVIIAWHGYKDGTELRSLKRSTISDELSDGMMNSGDKNFIQELGKYIEWWTVTFNSCSTGSTYGEDIMNMAHAVAKWWKCKTFAPIMDAGSWKSRYNESWEVVFTDYYVPTAIYDGRKDIEGNIDEVSLSLNTTKEIDILANDGDDAEDFELSEGKFWNFFISKENEEKWRIADGNSTIIAEKKQIDRKYMLVIHTDEAREDQSFEIPYTSYSKRLPRTVVDTNGDETTYDNHFRVESDGKILLTIDWNTAISQVEKLEEHDVKLYPNPVLDILHLEFWDTTADKKGDFQIFTMNGNAVSHGNIVSTKENINVANLPTWNYLIKWIVGGQTFVKKFIKRSFH